jgi:hypothetical protein
MIAVYCVENKSFALYLKPLQISLYKREKIYNIVRYNCNGSEDNKVLFFYLSLYIRGCVGTARDISSTRKDYKPQSLKSIHHIVWYK